MSLTTKKKFTIYKKCRSFGMLSFLTQVSKSALRPVDQHSAKVRVLAVGKFKDF